MTAVQLTGLAHELHKAMLVHKLADKDAADWYDRVDKLNDCLGEVGAEVNLDWHCTDMDGYVEVSYWSAKLRHNITLDADAWTEYETLEELARELVRYNDKARTLEDRIQLTPEVV